MATNNTTVIGTMFDHLKFKLPNDEAIQFVANTLAERDDFSRLVPSYEANAGLTHHGLRQVSLPTGYLVDIGGSWKASKAEFESVVDTMCTIRSTLQDPVDLYKNCSQQVAMAKLNASKASHVEAVNQGMMNMILNGPSTPNQSAIVGILQRAPYTSVDGAFTFDAGGSGTDLEHALLIKPGIDTFHALHNPYHPTMGVSMEDKGEQLISGLGTSSDEHRYDIFIEFMLQKGIHIEDQRACKLIANVACAAADDPGTDLINTIIDASMINAPKGGNLITYDANMNIVDQTKSPWILFCGERLHSKLVRSTNDKLKVYTSVENVWNTKVSMIGDDIVIARMDALNHVLAGTTFAEIM